MMAMDDVMLSEGDDEIRNESSWRVGRKKEEMGRSMLARWVEDWEGETD